jgi:hypothetical protein
MRAPLVLPEDRVLVSRGTSSILLKLTREGGAWKAAEAWRSPRLKGGLSPTVYALGSLYGFGGQYLLCVDAASGELRWREKTNSGSLIRVGRQLVLLGDQSGVLRLAEAQPSGYRERARAAAFGAGAQSITGPNYADGRFLRLAEDQPSGYRELDRAAAFGAGAQSTTGPSYADGRIFVRNVEEMVAYALAAAPAAGAGVKP